MTKEEYLKQRLDDQIRWYEDKSKTNKNWYKAMQLLEIASAAIIPFIAGLGASVPNGQIVIGILGVVIAVCAGASTLNKFQENWIVYRTTAETLKHEKYLFLTNSQPYSDEDQFMRLVERVEALISKENSQWSRYTKKVRT